MNQKVKLLKPQSKSVIRVGDGRGFIVEHEGNFLVITAAHCLPYFPPCHLMSYLHERTYQNLLAPLGSAPNVWAECLFVDPISDTAVLGSPDNQALFEESEAYEALTDGRAIPIGETREEQMVWLLYLDGQWRRARVKFCSRFFSLLASSPIQAGMSGSPIINANGVAVGLVNVGNDGSIPIEGPAVHLPYNLPGWLRAI